MSGTTNRPSWPWRGQANPSRLLWLALPVLPRKLCLVGELSGSSSPFARSVWKEAASGGGCSTLCHELFICVKIWQSRDLVVASPFPVPSHVSPLTSTYFQKVYILPSSLKQMLFLHLKICLQQNYIVFIVSCHFNKYWTMDFSASAVM